MTQGAHVVRKEMGYTHEEFIRLLPKAVGGADMRIEGSIFEVRDGERSLRIELGEEGERRIASFRLPMTPVSLVFSGYTEAGIEAVLDRFWRTYQKGGG
jgi:hypothetical protein